MQARAGFCVLVSALVAGCGDSGAGSTGLHGGAPDAGDGGAPNAGSRTALPLVDYLGGPVIAAPKVVTITYGADDDPAADPLRAFLEDFDDAITTTAWWDAVRAGYCDGDSPPKCVGQGTSGGHVHLTDKPAAAYDDGPTGGTLRALLQGYVTSVLPAPDADTIYVLFLAPSTTVTVDGYAVSCRQFGAYHASFEATLPDGGTATVPYVVVPRCSEVQDVLTMAVSHELVETAVDPVDPDPALGGNAYSMTTDTVWPRFGSGSEVADLCEWTNGSNVPTMEGSYLVARSWSNLAAAAAHDPCVPAPDPATSPYFNVAPSRDALTLAVGEPATLDLDAFSDGPTADWTVSVADVSERNGGTAMAARAMLDRSTANDGTRLHLTITLNSAAPPTRPALLLLTSRRSPTSRIGSPILHQWPIAVTSR